jgi:hypothetical protein
MVEDTPEGYGGMEQSVAGYRCQFKPGNRESGAAARTTLAEQKDAAAKDAIPIKVVAFKMVIQMDKML